MALRKPVKQTYTIEKNLSKDEAWRRAVKIAAKDFRGMKYDKKTGKLVLI